MEMGQVWVISCFHYVGSIIFLYLIETHFVYHLHRHGFNINFSSNILFSENFSNTLLEEVLTGQVHCIYSFICSHTIPLFYSFWNITKQNCSNSLHLLYCAFFSSFLCIALVH